jgi:predicted porin
MQGIRWGWAIAGLAAATAVQAQSITLYGTIDTGVEYLNHIGPNSESTMRVPGITGTQPSKWGLRGVEDLGGGLKAQFVLESGILPDTGSLSQGGRIFGREAQVGLSASWGTLFVGRQYTMLSYALRDANITGTNIYGSGSLDAYIPNARVDNSVGYLGRFGGFTVGATYSFGRDAVNAGPSPGGTNCAGENAADSKQCREWSAMVKYNAPTWGAAVAYDALRGGPGAFAGLTSSDLSDTRLVVNGYLQLGEWKLGAGILRRDNEGSPVPRSDLLNLGVAYRWSPSLLLDAELLRLDYKDSPNRATLGTVRAQYALSKRTTTYATLGHISNDGNLAVSVSAGQPGGNPPAGDSQMGVLVGIRHSF